MNLIGWFIKLSVQTFQQSNFVYHHWERTLIYRSMSDLFRSIDFPSVYLFTKLAAFYLLYLLLYKVKRHPFLIQSFALV